MADKVSIELDGGSLRVQAGLTVKEILGRSDYKISKYPTPEGVGVEKIVCPQDVC